MFHVVSDLSHEKRDPNGAASAHVRVCAIGTCESWPHLRTCLRTWELAPSAHVRVGPIYARESWPHRRTYMRLRPIDARETSLNWHTWAFAPSTHVKRGSIDAQTLIGVSSARDTTATRRRYIAYITAWALHRGHSVSHTPLRGLRAWAHERHLDAPVAVRCC